MIFKANNLSKQVSELALPAGVGFLFHTFFNLTDNFYAGMVSTTALAALSLSFPLFFALIAAGSGLGQGTTAILSKLIGAGKSEEAGCYMADALSLGLIISVVVGGLGLILQEGAFTLLGAEQGEYLTQCTEYMSVIFLGAPTIVLASIFNGALQATGDTKSFRNWLIAGAIANIFLDPLFMFGFDWGLAGAAFATMLVELSGTVYLAYKLRGRLPFDFVRKPNVSRYFVLLRQGVPAIFGMLTITLGAFVITYFVSGFGKEAVAAYGAALRIEQMVILPAVGINYAVLALVGRYFGKRDLKQIKSVIKEAFILGFKLVVPAALIMLLFRRPVLGLFASSEEVLSLGADYLVWASAVSLVYLGLFILASAFQGLQRPEYSLIIGLLRQVAFPLALIPFLLNIDYQLSSIWLGIFLVNFIALLISAFLLRRIIGGLDFD